MQSHQLLTEVILLQIQALRFHAICVFLLLLRVLMKHSLTKVLPHSVDERKTVIAVTYFIEATDQGLCLLNNSSFHSPFNHSLDVLFFVLFCHCCICPSRFQLSLCHLQNKDEQWNNNAWITLCFKFKVYFENKGEKCNSHISSSIPWPLVLLQ